MRRFVYETLISAWPLQRGKVRWLNLVSRALRIQPYGRLKTRVIGGHPILLDPGDENDRFYYFGMAGKSHLFLLRKILRPGDCVIDVGANVGYFAAACIELIGPTGTVHAIEAAPHLFDRLNESLGRTQRCIKLHHAAVWRHSGEVTLHLASNSGWSSLVRNPTFCAVSMCAVPALTIDELIEREAIQHVRLLKLDIEGAETDALVGAENSLLRGIIDAVLLEAEPCRLRAFQRTGAEIAELMQKHGLTPVAFRVMTRIRHPACDKALLADRFYPVSAALATPGQFNADYLYARQNLADEIRNALFFTANA